MKKIPDIINRLWNVCGQMEVGALLTCGSGIISGIFFIISHREDLETEDHSLKNLRSIHLGYLRADDCRWKKVDQTISDRTATDYLY